MSDTSMVDVSHTGETFLCYSPFDKLRLVGRNWPVRNGQTRVVLFIVHGSGEHCQRYIHVAQFFNTYNVACVSFDWRGHGESDGERGFAPGLNAFFDDIECVIERVQTDLHPGIPIVIYSHGTGSVICLGHILLRPKKPFNCQGMIISTPSLCLRRRPTALLLFSSRAFANLNPHFRLPVEGNYTNVYTNDPEVVKAYRTDPLVHDRWPAKTTSIFLDLVLRLEKRIIRASCPLLIQHGVDDAITPIKGIRRWVRKHVKGDVQFKEWPGNFHELHNDLNKEEVLNFAGLWMEEKLNI
jgi:acylglycerol lipase